MLYMVYNTQLQVTVCVYTLLIKPHYMFATAVALSDVASEHTLPRQ